MQSTVNHPDPAKARAYFEDKLAFTTGPVELDRMIKGGDNITVVDVRAVEDFERGHIPGAINLPQEKWNSGDGLNQDRTSVIYCYTETCHLGARACVEFASRGFPVMEMEGGFKAWKAQGMEIERPPSNRLRRPVEAVRH